MCHPLISTVGIGALLFDAAYDHDDKDDNNYDNSEYNHNKDRNIYNRDNHNQANTIKVSTYFRLILVV